MFHSAMNAWRRRLTLEIVRIVKRSLVLPPQHADIYGVIRHVLLIAQLNDDNIKGAEPKVNKELTQLNEKYTQGSHRL